MSFVFVFNLQLPYHCYFLFSFFSFYFVAIALYGIYTHYTYILFYTRKHWKAPHPKKQNKRNNNNKCDQFIFLGIITTTNIKQNYIFFPEHFSFDTLVCSCLFFGFYWNSWHCKINDIFFSATIQSLSLEFRATDFDIICIAYDLKFDMNLNIHFLLPDTYTNEFHLSFAYNENKTQFERSDLIDSRSFADNGIHFDFIRQNFNVILPNYKWIISWKLCIRFFSSVFNNHSFQTVYTILIENRCEEILMFQMKVNIYEVFRNVFMNLFVRAFFHIRFHRELFINESIHLFWYFSIIFFLFSNFWVEWIQVKIFAEIRNRLKFSTRIFWFVLFICIEWCWRY